MKVTKLFLESNKNNLLDQFETMFNSLKHYVPQGDKNKSDQFLMLK